MLARSREPSRAALPPYRISPQHRVQPEATILEILLLAGWAFEVAAGEREAALAATRAALEGWAANGLGFARGPDGERRFDPVEVVNFIKRTGFSGADGFWETRFVKTGRALVASLATRLDSAGLPLLDGAPQRRIALRLERTFNLARYAGAGRLRLKLPLPLAGRYLEDLVVVPDAAPTPDARSTVLPGRLEVSLPAGSAPAMLTLGAEVRFTAKALARSPAAGPAPDALYLRPSEGLIDVTERVAREASARAVAGDAHATAMAFWSFLIDGFACGPIHYDAIDPVHPLDWVLEARCYDCQLGAALLAALCRAVGIPARIVGGNVLYRLAPTNHYWAEIWIGEHGWLPFDFLSWDLSLGGRDPRWRDMFAGRCDARMVTQCFPTEFVGPMSVRIPDVCQMHQVSAHGSASIALFDVSLMDTAFTDRLLWRDDA